MYELLIERLKRLRQRHTTWQGGLVELPVPISPKPGQPPVHPKIAIWLDPEHEQIQTELPPDADSGTPEFCLQQFVVFEENTEEAGYRPSQIEVKDADLAEHLRPRLAKAGIEVVFVEKLPLLEDLEEGLVSNLEQHDPDLPGLLDSPGVTTELLAGFADAAAAFYKSGIWKLLRSSDLIRIDSPVAPEGMATVSIMLEDGQPFLGFYRSRELYEQNRTSDDPIQAVENESLTGLWFSRPRNLPTSDVELWAKYDWPLVDDALMPEMWRFKAGVRRSRPTAHDIRFTEGLLQTLAQTTEAELDSAAWSKTVTTVAGTETYQLQLPYLVEDRSAPQPAGTAPGQRLAERASAAFHRMARQHPEADIDELNKLAQKHLVGNKDVSQTFPPVTPLEQAQELVYEAEEHSGRKQIQLLRQAIETYPDCADAYVMLGDSQRDLDQALELYETAVEIGRRTLPNELLDEPEDLWGMLEARPYLRALFALAETLVAKRRPEEAVAVYQELLRLSSNDNQGARYSLLSILLECGQNKQAERLLDQYKDDIAALWPYARALIRFRAIGDTPRSRRLLKEAIRTNEYLAMYLLDQDLPEPKSDFGYMPGDSSEACVFGPMIANAWLDTAGALEWLERVIAELSRKRTQQTAKTRKQAKRRKRSR